MHRHIRLLVAAVCAGAAYSAIAAGPRFHAIDLGVISTAIFDINNADQVTGWTMGPDNTRRGAVYSAAGTQLLGMDSATYTIAYSTNMHGTTAGRARFINGFVTLPATFVNGEPQVLPMPAGFESSTFGTAHDINDSGLAVGYVSDAQSFMNGVVWGNSGPKLVPPLAGDNNMLLYAVNSLGHFVGASELEDANYNTLGDRGIIGKSPTNVRAIRPPAAPYTHTILLAINDQDQASGYAYYIDADNLWHTQPIVTNGQRTVRLPAPAACADSCYTRGINNAGHVMIFNGTSQVYFFDGKQSWDMAKVSDAGPGWTLTAAAGPNDSDNAAVMATDVATGQAHVLLMQRVR